MTDQSVRTTVDIPAHLYRKLKEQAATRGSSIRELVLAAVTGVLWRRNRVQFPLIASDGPKVDLSSEQIYQYIDFP